MTSETPSAPAPADDMVGIERPIEMESLCMRCMKNVGPRQSPPIP